MLPEQILIASASVILLFVGLMQAYQKAIEKADVKEDSLRDELYKQKHRYLQLELKYDKILSSYKSIRQEHKNLLNKYKFLYIEYMKIKRELNDGQK